jgi:hypothetical protein
MDWLSERTKFLCSTGIDENEAKTQASEEYNSGMNIMSADYVETSTRTPVLPCIWHATAKGCRYKNNCRQSHGVIGVAANLETFSERKSRLDFEQKSGVPLLDGRNTIKATVQCRYMSRQGGCRNGDKCSFSHKPTPCRAYFSKDGCTSEICVYSHEKEPCRFLYSRNGCKLADQCKYSHESYKHAEKVKNCDLFPNCVNGPGCAYNLLGEVCASV